jgi:hypothetical protein
MSDVRCENCRFYDDPSEECRRHAPRPSLTEFYGLCLALSRKDDEALDLVNQCASQADFPKTAPQDWCGEFIAREEP